ncbi:hypothetical protein [Sorangium sp. So ce693]|uniref:hypothetical protein n=1 Tax=Sorangium sp. So ce693 TaxID=3133318 RepID=UPI003F63B34D
MLFGEMMPYLLVVDAMVPRTVPTFSPRVDEAWHQFVLFTNEYIDFCKRFSDRYVHHEPGYWLESTLHAKVAFDEFAATYESLFEERPPELWQDEHDLRPGSLALSAESIALAVERAKRRSLTDLLIGRRHCRRKTRSLRSMKRSRSLRLVHSPH